jgi:hypothetical protein
LWQRAVHDKKDPQEGTSYSHTGVVYLQDGRVFLLEASYSGGVRIVLLSERQPDLVVRMGLEWNEAAEDWVMEQLGHKYSLWEAIRAGTGEREQWGNKAFICTEFVGDVCDRLGYYFPKVKQLPDNFYAQLVQDKFEFVYILDPAETQI